MGYIKNGFKSNIPHDLVKEDRLTTEGNDVTEIEWMDSSTSTDLAIEVRVAKYQRHTNNAIYLRIHKPVADILELKDGDSIEVGFNKNYSKFGVRKVQRGIKLQGNKGVLYTSKCSPAFNNFDVDTMWYGFPEDVTVSPSGFVTCDVEQNNEALLLRKQEAEWNEFVNSEA